MDSVPPIKDIDQNTINFHLYIILEEKMSFSVIQSLLSVKPLGTIGPGLHEFRRDKFLVQFFAAQRNPWHRNRDGPGCSYCSVRETRRVVFGLQRSICLNGAVKLQIKGRTELPGKIIQYCILNYKDSQPEYGMLLHCWHIESNHLLRVVFAALNSYAWILLNL